MYYQNPFNSDFIGVLVLGDRQLSLNFKVKGNLNSSVEMIAWNREPYNLTGNPNLTINYSLDSGATWAPLIIDVTTTAAILAAVTCQEIADALNANATFQAIFTASVTTDFRAGNYLKIRATKPRERWKAYISNTSAESIVRFNKMAGVAELPSYFGRHTIANLANYPDSTGLLIELSNPVAGVDVAIVSDAGLNPAVVQPDWQLFNGNSGIFNFQKLTVDGSNRITQIIEYPAGAGTGDFARMIKYTYSAASNTQPSQIAEIPYTLQVGDLITP